MNNSSLGKLAVTMVMLLIIISATSSIVMMFHRGITQDVKQRYDPDPVISRNIQLAVEGSRTDCLKLLHSKHENARRWGVAAASGWMIKNGKDAELIELLKEARDDPNTRVRNAAASVWEFESSHWK